MVGRSWLIARAAVASYPGQRCSATRVPRGALRREICFQSARSVFPLCGSGARSLPSSDHGRATRRVSRHSLDPRPQRRHRSMSWISRLFGGRSEQELKPQRLDYLNEALALERSGDFDAAITSYGSRYATKPDDTKVLQNLAIALTRVEPLRGGHQVLSAGAHPQADAVRARTTDSHSSTSARRTRRSHRAP